MGLRPVFTGFGAWISAWLAGAELVEIPDKGNFSLIFFGTIFYLIVSIELSQAGSVHNPVTG